MPENSKTMDLLARIWERCGDWFGHRPIAVIGTLLGAIIFAGAMGFVIVRQNDQQTHIEQVQSAFCNERVDSVTSAQQEANCRDLLNRLLKNPTPEQARRLRQIIQETK